MSSIGEAIKDARGESVSQRDLAKRTGISQPTIARIESGTRAVKAAELAAIAGALGITVADLVGGSPAERGYECAARTDDADGAVEMRRHLMGYFELERYLDDLGVEPSR